MEKHNYRFSAGPWNIHEGADPFGPPVRPSLNLDAKLRLFKDLEIDAVQFHDDDAVPDLDTLSAAQIRQQTRVLRQQLADNQVRVLDTHQYWQTGMIGLDVKALRTQPVELATKHLRNSIRVFLRFVSLVRRLDQQAVDTLIALRDYEELDWLILNHLLAE